MSAHCWGVEGSVCVCGGGGALGSILLRGLRCFVAGAAPVRVGEEKQIDDGRWRGVVGGG